MKEKYLIEYADEIERLQKKGGVLTNDELSVLDYCNNMLVKYKFEGPSEPKSEDIISSHNP